MQLYKTSTMESPKEPPLLHHHHHHHQHHPLTPLDQFGLEPLNLNLPKIPSQMIFDLLSPTSSSLLSAGDYIGMESSVDVLKDSDDINQVVAPPSLGGGGEGQDGNLRERVRCRREQRWGVKSTKEFPPPIPMLARTENLLSHMPWVLKRHYTSDGRLVLTEEKVRHHEYFRAHRSHGRLTLQLVPLDDEGLPFSGNGNEKKGNETANNDEDECELDLDQCFDDHGGEDDGEGECDDEEDDGDDELVEDQSRAGIGGSASTSSSPVGKCFNFNSVGTGSPCIFGVPVPAIRQVHS